MIKIQDIENKMLELIRANPDNIYNSQGGPCSYLRGVCSNGSEGCLLGQALIALGIEPSRLGLTQSIASLLYNLYDIGLISEHPDDSHVTNRIAWAQSIQDMRHSWGRILTTVYSEHE